MTEASEFRLEIEAPDPNTAEDQTLALIRELRSAPGVVVRRLASPAPEGAKSGMSAVLAPLALSVASGGLTPLIMILHDWVKRRRKPVTVSLQIGDATVSFPQVDLEEALEILRRHGLAGTAEDVSERLDQPQPNSD